MLKNKIIVKKIRNIVILLMAIIIMIGAYKNINRSRAEEVIEIGAIALDNYGYLAEEEFVLEAIQTKDGLYEIELPESINTKKISQIVNITLEDLSQPIEESAEENIEQVEGQEQISEDTNTVEQMDENAEIIDDNKFEIIDNKIILTETQMQTKKINIELKYDIAIVEKNEQEEYNKILLSEKSEEEMANFQIPEQAQILYNKVLTYEDETSGKLVEVRGYFPKEAQLKIQELSQQQIIDNFEGIIVDFAYDIRVIEQIETEVGITESEIVPSAYGEKCEIYIKDERVKQGTKIYEKEEDNNIVLILEKENKEGIISFEEDELNIYAFDKDTIIVTEPSTDTNLTNSDGSTGTENPDNSDNQNSEYGTDSEGIDVGILSGGTVNVGAVEAVDELTVGEGVTISSEGESIAAYIITKGYGPSNLGEEFPIGDLGTSVYVTFTRPGIWYVALYNSTGNKIKRVGPYAVKDEVYTPGKSEYYSPVMTVQMDTGVELMVSGGENSNPGNGTNAVTADQIGKYVTNYKPALYENSELADGGIQWQILYGDGENIYLIADQYVHGNYFPKSKAGTTPSTSAGTAAGYTLYIGSVSGDYTGWSDIPSDIQTKWFKKYNNYSGQLAKEPNSYAFKGAAYLLDKDAWSTFKDTTFADYAVGAPTLELLADSYNLVYGSDTTTKNMDLTVTYGSNNFVGYAVNGVNSDFGAFGVDPYTNVWFVGKKAYAASHDGYYVASPNYVDDFNIWTAAGIEYSVGLQQASAKALSGTAWGIRPVICLKSTYGLVSNGDGTYKIEAVGNDEVYEPEPTIPKIEEIEGGWAKSHTAIVRAQDTGSGLKAGAQVKYAWTTDATNPPTTWEGTATFKKPDGTAYTEGTTDEVQVEITKSGLTGIYYLWLAPVGLEDCEGNVNNTTIRTGEVKFDNQNPVVNASPANKSWVNSDVTVTISATDNSGSGLLTSNSYQYYVSKNNANPTSFVAENWKTYNPNGTDHTLNSSGEYYIFVKRVNDICRKYEYFKWNVNANIITIVSKIWRVSIRLR